MVRFSTIRREDSRVRLRRLEEEYSQVWVSSGFGSHFGYVCKAMEWLSFSLSTPSQPRARVFAKTIASFHYSNNHLSNLTNLSHLNQLLHIKLLRILMERPQ